MEKIKNILNVFMRTSLIIYFIIIFISNIVNICLEIIKKQVVFSAFNIMFILIYILIILVNVFLIKSKIDKKYKVILITLLGGILRILWMIKINTPLSSDYTTIYKSAKGILVGDFSDIYGFGYFARFTHLFPTVIYFSILLRIFPISHLTVYKMINFCLSIIGIILIYLISKQIFKKEKIQLICLSIASIFPAFISYLSTYCTENLAIWLYLLAILLFFINNKYDDTKEKLGYIFIGIILAIANLFRTVGIIFLIAIVVYLFIFDNNKKREKIDNIILIISSYLIITIVFSNICVITGLIDRQLYNPIEPKTTSMLKGLNTSSKGMWNKEDAEFIEENLKNDNFKEQCNDIIKERIKNTSAIDIAKLFIMKTVIMWKTGDSGGIYWATLETEYMLSCISVFYNIMNMVLIIFCIIGFFKKNQNIYMNLLYILFGGYNLMFFVLEIQPRYTYIISYLVIFFALNGIEKVIEILENRKNIYLEGKRDDIG